MARIRVFIVLVLAVTAGGGLALGTYNYMQKAQLGHPASMQTRSVVVAKVNLDIGADLTKDDIKTIDWPAASIPVGAFTTVDEVAGRGLIMPVVANEPILPMKLASKEAGAGLPPAIPEGLRALSVRVNEVVGVSGYVLPGTRVDVLSVLSPTDKKTDTTSKVILTNVQVLAAGTKIERDDKGGKPVAVNVVTLLVNPEESERLTLAALEGKIQLALRNPLDKGATETPGVKPAALFGNQKQVPMARQRVALSAPRNPVPVVIAPGEPEPVTVEVIRGDKRAREVVRQER
jgi:pilus assembly protein CpaB